MEINVNPSAQVLAEYYALAVALGFQGSFRQFREIFTDALISARDNP